MNKPIHPNFFIPETFGDAVSYEAQVKYLHQRLQTLEEEGIPTPDLAELKQRVTTLETEVTAIQGEIEDLDLESITAHFEQIDADIEQLQATQSQQGTTLQDYNTRILELETTADSQDQAIDALDGRVTGVTTAVANVAAEQTQLAQDIAGKQDQLTAGANITIQNNVISASGGGGTIDIDTTVTPNSQHAVTSEGIYNAIHTVETQHTTDINRIDGELAGKASTASVTTLRGDMEDEIERVEPREMLQLCNKMLQRCNKRKPHKARISNVTVAGLAQRMPTYQGYEPPQITYPMTYRHCNKRYRANRTNSPQAQILRYRTTSYQPQAAGDKLLWMIPLLKLLRMALNLRAYIQLFKMLNQNYPQG